MDDRESVYMDTISLNSHSEVTKKGLSQSRQTIYHSAEDVHQQQTTDKDEDDDEYFTEKINSNKLPIYVGGVGGEYCHPALNTDEVSARLLLINHKKKKTVTYSQWKSRVTFSFTKNHEIFFFSFRFFFIAAF